MVSERKKSFFWPRYARTARAVYRVLENLSRERRRIIWNPMATGSKSAEYINTYCSGMLAYKIPNLFFIVVRDQNIQIPSFAMKFGQFFVEFQNYIIYFFLS